MPEKIKIDKPEKISAQGELMSIEKQEGRPRYRYYFHGTLEEALGGIEKEGIFKFQELHPNLSSSPLYCLGYTEGREEETMKKIQGKDAEPKSRGRVLLVIEPGEEYNVFLTDEGRPIETEDRVITRGRWKSQHRYLAKEKQRNMGIYYEGERNPSEISKDSIKMIIESNPELQNIFKGFDNELSQGNVDEEKYIELLMKYFEEGKGIIKNEIDDPKELARNMIVGHLEYYIVRAVRNIFLNIKHYQGKEVIINRKPLKAWGKNRLVSAIENLNKLKPENSILRRYLEGNYNYFQGLIEKL